MSKSKLNTSKAVSHISFFACAQNVFKLERESLLFPQREKNGGLWVKLGQADERGLAMGTCASVDESEDS